MKKNTKNSQDTLNKILIGSVVALALYSAVLTYVVFSLQKSNQSINDSFAEQLFHLQINTHSN
jgi:hypothetical protein